MSILLAPVSVDFAARQTLVVRARLLRRNSAALDHVLNEPRCSSDILTFKVFSRWRHFLRSIAEEVRRAMAETNPYFLRRNPRPCRKSSPMNSSWSSCVVSLTDVVMDESGDGRPTPRRTPVRCCDQHNYGFSCGTDLKVMDGALYRGY